MDNSSSTKSQHTGGLTMIVAVAVAYSPPPQHSPMLGHLASSHTWKDTNTDTGMHTLNTT